MSASSFGVMAVLLGYAAITSRLLLPSAFGACAVALSGVGLIGMLGGSSLGQSAARRDHDSVHLNRSLATLAVIVGCGAALVAIVLAPLWGTLSGGPESVPVTRVLALGIPVTALAAVLAGVLRRSGRTSAVAGRTAIGQLTGMAVGLAAVTAWSLGVASVTGAVVTGALLAAALPQERLTPATSTAASIDDAACGVKSAGMIVGRLPLKDEVRVHAELHHRSVKGVDPSRRTTANISCPHVAHLHRQEPTQGPPTTSGTPGTQHAAPGTGHSESLLLAGSVAPASVVDRQPRQSIAMPDRIWTRHA